MNITSVDIKMNSMQKNDRLVAYVSVVIEDAIVIHDMKIIKGNDRMFVSFPSKKVREEYIEIVHPINKPARQLVENRVLAEYDNMIKSIKKNLL